MNKNKTKLKFWFSIGVVAFVCGCAHKSGEFQYENLKEEVTAIKKDGGYYKVGNPYKVMGQYYTPEENYNYSEVGIASWYGDDFHNKKTANGETYDMRAITAAHRTLPLPSIVKVTNLENGRSIIARVNDRGPYVKNRIIDVSQRGAELLGYRKNGTAKVKVEILPRESRAIKEAMLSKSNKAKGFEGPINYSLASNNDVNVKSGEAIIVADNSVKMENKTVAEKGDFFVQVGAFSDYNKAKEMANNMKRFGKVVIHEAYLSKDGVYRVRIGAYKSRDEALQILDRVLDYGHADVSIVQG